MTKSQAVQSRAEKMRAAREAAARRARLMRLAVWAGGVVIIGLVVAIVVVAVMSAGDGKKDTKADGPLVTPAHLVHGAVPAGDPDAPVTLELYFDYMCPACGAFEQTYGAMLSDMVDAGQLRVELRPMTFLDRSSNGTEYSTRTANALATVVDQAPEAVWAFHAALYANQPSEGSSGLSDDQIESIAVDAGVPPEVASTFTDGTFEPWAAKSNQAAFDAGVQSTPTVIIDGEQWTEGDLGDVLAKALADSRRQ